MKENEIKYPSKEDAIFKAVSEITGCDCLLSECQDIINRLEWLGYKLIEVEKT